MNPQKLFIQFPLALLVTLSLGSCAHSPDRHAAQRDDANVDLVSAQHLSAPGVRTGAKQRSGVITIEGRAPQTGQVAKKPTSNASAQEQLRAAAPEPPSHDNLQTFAQNQPNTATITIANKTEEGGKASSFEEKRGYTNPDGALEFRRLQMKDGEGKIPADGLEKGRKHVALMKAAREERLRALRKKGLAPAPGAEAAGIEPNSWTWLGPGNIGGRIRALVIHPTAPANMWVGSAGGGIWRTTNGGTSWFPVDDFMANLAVCALVINPADPNVMYAGTGEGFGNGDQLQGAGIFKSIDGGVTWSQLASTTTSNFFYVNRLSLPFNGNTILAATRTGVWRSTDAGATWSQRTFDNTLDVDFHQGLTTRAIAGELGTARYSTDGGNSWTQASFTPPISNGGTARNNGRVELAFANPFNLIVYASVNRTTGTAPNTSNGEVYRSTDGGQTYMRVNFNNNLLGGQGWYDNAIWVNPQDSNFVLVGGVLPYRSMDGGITFTTIGNASTNLPHADHHIFVEHPDFNNTTNRTVFFGNDGGIHEMANVADPAPATNGWRELNNNLGITQFYSAAGNVSSGVIVGGTQDNGTLWSTGPEGWSEISGGDGGYSAADPTDPNVFYGEYTHLTIHRKTAAAPTSVDIFAGISDAGDKAPNPQTANFIAPFILDTNETNTMLAGGSSLWRSRNVKDATPTWACITNYNGGPMSYSFTRSSATNGSAVITPTLGHRFVVGNQVNLSFLSGNLFSPVNYTGAFVTSAVNGTTTFTVAITGTNLPSSGSGTGNTSTDNRISAIALSPISSALILVGHNGGDIYRTINGLLGDAQVPPSWTKIDTAALPNGRMVTRLVIDPNHSTNWYYATFGGFESDNVWRSTDNGATWVDVSGSGATGLPSVPVRTLVYHPTDSNLLYVGTEIGIFTSEDAGATWEPSQDGPANVSVDELFWMGGNLIAATHGRGIYRASSGIYVDWNVPLFAPQFGTIDFPFRTVRQGKDNASRYQPVWIKPGNYNETLPLIIDNPNGIELRVLGSGTVTIGPP